MQQLEWARQVSAHTAGQVLILCPLAVAAQTVAEAEKFGFPPVRHVHETVRVSVADDQVVVTRPDDKPESRALHGLTRALINNMVTGVGAGFTRKLEQVYRDAIVAAGA